MASFLNLETGKYPFSLDDIRKLRNNISLPRVPTPEQLKKVGFIEVNSIPKPEGVHVKEGYPSYVNGAFYQTWTVDENIDLGGYKEKLKKRIAQTYKQRIAKGDIHRGARFNLTVNEELHFVFLECLFLRDRDSKEAVFIYDYEGSSIEMSWSEALTVIEALTETRRQLKREYNNQIHQLRDCVSVEDCRQLEKRFNQQGVFLC